MSLFSVGAQKLFKLGREAFLGSPRITSARNAADLRPRASQSVMQAAPEDFMGRYTVKHGETGSTVFDGDTPIASYDKWNTLVVDPAHRREGIATELVAQRRMLFPDQPPATERTPGAQAAQEAAWRRIEQEARQAAPQTVLNAPLNMARSGSSNLLAGVGGAAVGAGLLGAPQESEAGVGGRILRKLYRAETPGNTQRIKTGEDAWDSYLFGASDPASTAYYGDELYELDISPDANVLFEGSRDFRSLAKGTSQMNMLDQASEIARRAQAAGYDAVHFKQQGNVGTAVLNPNIITSRRHIGPTSQYRKGSGYARPGMMAATGAGGAALMGAQQLAPNLLMPQGDQIKALNSNVLTQVGDYLTENRPSEMDALQRALQRLDQFQGLGEWLQVFGQGDRTTLMQDVNAALDVAPF